MAVSDWIPMASTIGGTLVGLGGVSATLRASSRQRDTALAIARQQAEHQWLMLRDERQQRRLEAAYSGLLKWLTQHQAKIAELAEATGFTAAKGPVKVAEEIEAAIRDLEVAVPSHVAEMAYLWSEEMAELMETYRQLIIGARLETIFHGFEFAKFGESESARRKRMEDDGRKRLADYRKALEATRRIVEPARRQVRTELVQDH